MSIKPRLIYDNFWRKGTALTPSSEDAKHPLTDTQVDTLSMYWKAANKTAPMTLPINLGPAKEIDFVAILGHNFEDIGGDITIYFEGDDDDTFATVNLVTKTIPYNATNIFEFFTAFTRSHVQLRVEKGAGDFDTEPQVATILCGKYSEFNRRPIKGFKPGKEDITSLEESDARVIFAQPKVILNEYGYAFEALDGITKNIILAFLEECGKHRAFVWCTDHTAPNTNSYLVRNSEISYPVFQYPPAAGSPEAVGAANEGWWNWRLAMKEIA